MKVLVWSDPEIVRMSRAHQLTSARLETFMRTHTALVEWEADDDAVDPPKTAKRLTKMTMAREPAGTTHYAMRSYADDGRDVWSFWVVGDPWVGVYTNCQVPPEELEPMAAEARESIQPRRKRRIGKRRATNANA